MFHLCAVSESKITLSWPTSTSPYLRPPARSYTCRTAPVAVCCVSTSQKLPRDCAFAEQALAGADNHSELPNTKRVDQIMLEQGLEEVAAAVDLNLATFLYLELCNLLGYVAFEQVGIVPGDLIQRPRSDELRPGVEGSSDLVRRVGGLGPRSREDVIGLAAEKKSTGLLGPLSHDFDKLLVKIGN